MNWRTKKIISFSTAQRSALLSISDQQIKIYVPLVDADPESQPSKTSQASNLSGSQFSNSDVSWQPSHSQSSTVSQFSELLEDSDDDGTCYIFSTLLTFDNCV